MVDHGFGNAHRKNQAQRKGKHLRDREGKPHQLHPARQRQQPRRRKQHDELSGKRNKHTVNTVAKRLKQTAGNDAEGSEQKAETDDPQSGNPDLKHILRGVKQVQKILGRQLENRQPHRHNRQRIAHAETDGANHPFPAPRAVIVGNDGHHAVVEPKDRHENEALHLEIDAENRRGGRGKADEDPVHSIGHDRADGLHNDGRNAHRIDFADDLQIRFESL